VLYPSLSLFVIKQKEVFLKWILWDSSLINVTLLINEKSFFYCGTLFLWWCLYRLDWSACCFRVKTCLARFLFYLCPINLAPYGTAFEFWWAGHFWLEIGNYCLVISFRAGLMSSLVIRKLRGVFMIMEL
jgi:hypothetical protein